LRFQHKKHLFFDLDHTLWDYDTNSALTLKQLHKTFGLEAFGLYPLEKFIDSFHKANLKVWDLFEENYINRHELRHKRLELVFEEFGLPNQILDNFHEKYYEICSRSSHLIEGTIEVLEILQTRFELHIITNGFDDAQYNKLDFSGLSRFFKTVTTSEAAGNKKPETEYFDFALQKARARKEESLIIGDGLRTDVAGAIRSGLDVIWFNDSEKICPYPNILEIKSLRELITILLIES
jgi:YjjG family noncanonical pyrimidine nucleotidase